jgi:hypothetical protein
MWRDGRRDQRGRVQGLHQPGINVRLLDAEAAKAMASMRVMDDQFKTRRIYTAWDNIGDEACSFAASICSKRRASIPTT